MLPWNRALYDQAAAHTVKAGVAWTPASLTGLQAWYKADGTLLNGSSVAPSNNDQLAQWNDGSGHSYNLTGNWSGGSSAVYQSAGMNGKPAVKCTGTSGASFMSVASVLFGGGGSAFFYGYASSPTGAAAFRRWGGYISAGDTSTDGAHSCNWRATNSSTTVVYGTVGGDNTSVETISADTGMRIGLIVDVTGGKITSVFNGVKQTGTAGTISTFANFVTNGTLIIGGVSSVGACADFSISEWIVSNAVPSAPDIASADTYLQRWN